VTAAFWCEWAWLDDAPVAGVRVRIRSTTVTSVDAGVGPAPGDHRLAGLVLPGFADAHSHAFHRALRGRTHGGGGSFWTWREAMYDVAARLDPDRYLELATAVYAEAALAGFTVVGEFHYVHHRPGGRPYADPNAMGDALREAARRAGVRLTLLDTCYLAGGFGQPLTGVQLRFGDASAAAWADRVSAQRPDASTRLGAAVHSVRAVPAAALGTVAAAVPQRPLHVHLSEQPAENSACLAAHGCSPGRLLADHGVLSPRTTAVHATHLAGDDVALLAASGTGACLCPTTERDLADGLGAARRLADAGVALCLGTDQHAVVDGLEEARAMEMHERLASGRRGRFAVPELVHALTSAGNDALGWPGAGRIAPGSPADLVALRLDSVRTAGCEPAQVVLAATAADVHTVVSGGTVVVSDGRHGLGDVGRLLAGAIAALAGAEPAR
jgi:formiminoglutamate deiminase